MRPLVVITILFHFELGLLAQTDVSKPGFTRIWQRSNADVSVRLEGIVPHEPAFIGEDKMRARLRLVNGTKMPIFVNAFDLSSSENDRALLHDVFEGEACRQALASTKRNDRPSGALGIGYSRLHTSSIMEIQPGKSLEFSVPLDHLSDGRCVRVRYWTENAKLPASEDGYRFLWLGPSR
jgi:hypothetical protein